MAQEASSTAVMVHWPPPTASAHCPVSSYTVEYRQEGVWAHSQFFHSVRSVRFVLEDVTFFFFWSVSHPSVVSPDSLLWQQVASSREECLQIDTLIPGGHYQFRVRASNRWGIGPPSEPSNMVTLPSSSKHTHAHAHTFSPDRMLIHEHKGSSAIIPFVPDSGCDGAGIQWKENFESAFTEICEIGR